MCESPSFSVRSIMFKRGGNYGKNVQSSFTEKLKAINSKSFGIDIIHFCEKSERLVEVVVENTENVFYFLSV